MGTNFYVRGHRHEYDSDAHIGKRSAAGSYCWDCKITLCKAGESGIHYDSQWHDVCPKCGEGKAKETPETSAGGRELGFNKGDPKLKTGVQSCSSFSWAIAPIEWEETAIEHGQTCPTCGHEHGDKLSCVEDEYGCVYTIEEFRAVLDECPVRFTDLIGKDFS